DTRSKAIEVGAEALESFGDAAAAEVGPAFDHHARRLTCGVRVDDPHLVHAHGADFSMDRHRIRYNNPTRILSGCLAEIGPWQRTFSTAGCFSIRARPSFSKVSRS